MTHIISGTKRKIVSFLSKTGVLTEYWGSRGVILWRDSNGDSGQLPADINEVMHRLRCMVLLKGVSSDPGVECDRTDRRAFDKFIEEMGELIYRIKASGTPVDKLKEAGFLRPIPMSSAEIARNNNIRSKRKVAYIPESFFDE